MKKLFYAGLVLLALFELANVWSSCRFPSASAYAASSNERLPEPTPFLNDDICSAPSISADGQWVAWAVPGDGRMKTRDIISGTRTALNREGYAPVFAKTGTRIAYIKGSPAPIYTADLDGSNDRLVGS